MTKLSTILALSLFTWATLAQCEIKYSSTLNIQKVGKTDLICLAQNSEKPYTVFYTLASWCAPCRLHLPDAANLTSTGKVDLIIILVEPENDPNIHKAINFITSTDSTIRYVVLNNDQYGEKTKRRNQKLAEEMTESPNEVIDDYGKFILLNRDGQILYTTNWKDYNKDWKNSKKMLEQKILPLLK